MKTTVKYHLIIHLLGNNANSSHITSFSTVQEAVDCWEKEYKNRDKKDGYDEYWRKTPLRIQQVITNDFWSAEGNSSITLAPEKLSFIQWFKNLIPKKP